MCDLYQYKNHLREEGNGNDNSSADQASQTGKLLQTLNGTLEFFLIFPPSFFVKSIRLGVFEYEKD
jgi:hypothetical protein